jgi:O-methyltransferase
MYSVGSEAVTGGGRDWYAHKKTVQCYELIWERYAAFTMVPPVDYAHTLQLAAQARGISGCVVQCGVWKGGMAAGLVSILGTERQYFLCDSFEGLPPAREIDGSNAIEWQSKSNSPDYFDNCSACEHYAEEAMNLAGAKHYRLIKGWFDSTLATLIREEPIAFLHLDADWYDSTTICLSVLFDQVAEGGIIALDDYYVWDGCSRALHDFLSDRSAVERVRNLGNVCYLIKARPQSAEEMDHARTAEKLGGQIRAIASRDDTAPGDSTPC